MEGSRTCNGWDGKQALQVAVQLLPALLYKLHALLLAEDALGRQPQVVGGQVSGVACKKLSARTACTDCQRDNWAAAAAR